MSENRIDVTFKSLAARNDKALIAYICAGDPDYQTTIRLVNTMVGAGVDMVELGVPFSDPLADGPVIQSASQRALAGGATLAGVLELVGEIRRQVEIPLLLMGYYNPFLRYGLERFSREAASKGADGVIVPDLPREEAGVFRRLLRQRGLHLIPLVAPTTPPRRLEALAEQEGGFVYCVSLTGVTGARKEIPPDIHDFIARVRRFTRLPLALGFGISYPWQAQVMGEVADGVIVGSAFVSLVERYGREWSLLEPEIAGLVRALKGALPKG